MAEPKFLTDPYLEWAAGEGIPIVEDFGVDCLAVETKPWARMGANGAFVHVKGRGDYMNVYVCEIPGGGATTPQKHLYEETLYVLDGRGSTAIESPDGRRHTYTDALKTTVRKWAAEQEALSARGEFRDPRLGEIRVGDWHTRVTRARGIEAVTKVKNASLWQTHCEPEWAAWPMAASSSSERAARDDRWRQITPPTACCC